MKRMLDCQASDFKNMAKEELLQAIAGAEGRTIACETISSVMPMLGDITNAEFADAGIYQRSDYPCPFPRLPYDYLNRNLPGRC